MKYDVYGMDGGKEVRRYEDGSLKSVLPGTPEPDETPKEEAPAVEPTDETPKKPKAPKAPKG